MPSQKDPNKEKFKQVIKYEKDHFRVAIFGSARLKEGDPVYQQVFNLGKMIGEQKFDVITGGGPGLMEAANAGHMTGDPSNDAHSIGIRIELPFEQHENKHLEIKKDFPKFSSRLDEFMMISNVVVIVPGGVGTCLEFFYTWQLTQVKHICRIPIILIGKMWDELMKWVEKYPMKKGLISPKDADNICVVPNIEAAMSIIKATHKKFLADPEHCISLDKYE